MNQGVGLSAVQAGVRPASANIRADCAPAGLAADVAADETAFCALEADWRALEARVGADLFCSFDWAWCWWRHFGARERARPAVVTLRAGGQLVAVLPLAVLSAGPYRCAVLMGAGSGHYGDMLLDGQAAPAARVHAALRQALRRIGADTLQVDNVRDDSALAAFLATGRAHAGQPEASYVVKTRDFADFDAYLATRPARLLKDLRRRRRRLVGEGEVAYQVITDPGAIGEATCAATALKREWLAARGLHGRFLSRPQVDAWLVDVCRRALERGRLHFSTLTVGGRMAAVQIAFSSRDRLVGYFAAFDVEHGRHAVGKLHLEDHLRDVFGAGLDLDLLPPGDDYKREWAVEDVAARGYTVPLSTLGAVASLVHNPRQRERLKRVYLNLPGAVRAAFAARGLDLAGRVRRGLDRRLKSHRADAIRPEDHTT